MENENKSEIPAKSWYKVCGEAAHVGQGKHDQLVIYTYAEDAIKALWNAKQIGGWKKHNLRINVLKMDPLELVAFQEIMNAVWGLNDDELMGISGISSRRLTPDNQQVYIDVKISDILAERKG